MDARAEVGGDEPPLPSMDPRDPRDRFDVLEDSSAFIAQCPAISSVQCSQ